MKEKFTPQNFINFQITVLEAAALVQRVPNTIMRTAQEQESDTTE